MAIHRYSATEIFGIPLDSPAQLADGLPSIQRLMGSYDIEPKIVEPMDPTDITPYYWTLGRNKFRYFLSSAKRGKALIEMMPTYDESIAIGLDILGPIAVSRLETQRSYRLPEDQDCMVIVGMGSPRFAGQLCVHEALVDM